VDLRNHDARRLRRGLRHAYLHTVRTEAVFVGRAHMDKRDVERKEGILKQQRHLG